MGGKQTIPTSVDTRHEPCTFADERRLIKAGAERRDEAGSLSGHWFLYRAWASGRLEASFRPKPRSCQPRLRPTASSRPSPVICPRPRPHLRSLRFGDVRLLAERKSRLVRVRYLRPRHPHFALGEQRSREPVWGQLLYHSSARIGDQSAASYGIHVSEPRAVRLLPHQQHNPARKLAVLGRAASRRLSIARSKPARDVRRGRWRTSIRTAQGAARRPRWTSSEGLGIWRRSVVRGHPVSQ